MNEHTRDILTMIFVILFSLGMGVFLILWPWIERHLPKLPMPMRQGGRHSLQSQIHQISGRPQHSLQSVARGDAAGHAEMRRRIWHRQK